MKQTFGLLALALSLGCASANVPAPRSENADVRILSIDPTPGTRLTASSVLHAEIAYSISGYDPNAEYHLAPLFGTSKEGVTFNALNRMTDSLRLTSPEGTVTITHPIAPEWRSGRLTDPIRVSFYLLVMTGSDRSQAIGLTPVIEYPGAAR